MAGPGTLYQTTLTNIGILNVTAYAVYTASGGLNILIDNKDSTTNLQLAVSLPKTYNIGSLLQLAQYSPSGASNPCYPSGASGPCLTETSGVTIQGATVSYTNGSFSPGTPYYISPSGNQITVYVPALSAVLLQLQ